MQKLFSTVFSPFEHLNRHISISVKQKILAAACFLLMANTILRVWLPTSLQYMIIIVCGAVLTLLMIALTVQCNTFTEYRIKAVPLILAELVGLSFLLNGIYYRVLAYIAIGLIFSVLIPLLHLCITAYGAERFVRALARGILASYLISILVSLFSGPAITTPHFSLLYTNPNLFGYYLIAVTASLLLLHYLRDRAKKARTYLLYALLTTVLVFCFFSYSRTALASIVFQICLYALLLLLRRKGAEKGSLAEVMKKVLAIFLVFAITAGATFFLFSTVNKQIAAALPSIRLELPEYGEEGGIGDSLSNAGSYFSKGLNGDGTGDAFTSGRLGIWQAFLQNIGIFGHSSETREVIEVNRYYESTSAHNVYLQVCYSAGIIAGISMLLLLLWSIWQILKGLRNTVRAKTFSPAFLFAGVCVAGFFLPSMTSAGYMPFWYVPATLFWFSLGVLDTKPRIEIPVGHQYAED